MMYKVPTPINEPVKSYAPNSEERSLVLSTYDALYAAHVAIPLYINGAQIHTKEKRTIHPPHDHQHEVGTYAIADATHVKSAIETALEAREKWSQTSWQDRAAIFLKAAALIAGPYRYKMNAATMIGQSKNVYQAEIDSACELIDFFNFNAKFMTEIYETQPISGEGVWNRLEYRALEGFVYAITPFNFTAIAANLPAAPVLMGNVCVWKPSDHQVYSAQVIMEVLHEAGLPSGVINMITGDPVMITDMVLEHTDFSGLHFTGSTHVFQKLWQQIGANVGNYKNYPRIVGETGGKDFIWSHTSADSAAVATALLRGAFEYQGQKCSAASRAYIPKSQWNAIASQLKTEIATLKTGSPRDTSNFINAVIHEASFDNIVKYIEAAKASSTAEVIIGGTYDKSVGYFVDPTVIVTTDPNYATMEEEIFGPVLTVYVYEDSAWESVLEIIGNTSKYALTGGIFAKDRYVIEQAAKALQNAAGNFYINDKPSGAVVGQQPFGGARSSGTNDKAGSIYNLIRWVSPRTIKETFVPPVDYRYPFLEE